MKWDFLLEECQKPIILQKIINKKEPNWPKIMNNGKLKIFKEFCLPMKAIYAVLILQLLNKVFNGYEKEMKIIGLQI